MGTCTAGDTWVRTGCGKKAGDAMVGAGVLAGAGVDAGGVTSAAVDHGGSGTGVVQATSSNATKSVAGRARREDRSK